MFNDIKTKEERINAGWERSAWVEKLTSTDWTVAGATVLLVILIGVLVFKIF